ncbi:MAG: hypothetical protein LAN70_13315 [Acidobacteriia bacterium]|nr:hypothetical protein [Terriglobia bacterium]
MKPSIVTVLFVVCAVAAAAQAVPQSSAPSASSATSSPQSSQDANARQARSLLEECIQALGGQAWLNLQEMEQQGRAYAYSHGQPNSLGTLFWRFWKYPDKERIELTKQRDVVFINVGENGYEITYKGTAAMEPDQLADYNRRQRHSLEVVLRQWLNQPGIALFYDGPAVAEQKPADSVTILTADNDSVTLFLDNHTHLPIKKMFEWRDPADRLKNVEGEIFDNWRLEQGIMTPHSLLRTHNGDTTNQRFITNVRYNADLPDSLFQAAITYDPNKRPAKRR